MFVWCTPWLGMSKTPGNALELPIALNCSKLLQIAPNRFMVPNDSNWLQMAPNCLKWVQKAPKGSQWLEIPLNGSKWLQLAPNGSKRLVKDVLVPVRDIPSIKQKSSNICMRYNEESANPTVFFPMKRQHFVGSSSCQPVYRHPYMVGNDVSYLFMSAALLLINIVNKKGRSIKYPCKMVDSQ